MKKAIIWIIGFIIVAGVIGIFAFTPSPSSNNQSASHTNTAAIAAAIGKPAPDATFTTVDGKTHTLAEYKGQKVMLWLFATWCPSCKAGAQVLQENNGSLGAMKVIAVKTYGNAGYPGPSVRDFVTTFSPKLLTTQNWAWGNLSQQATNTYNPKNYPDIYYLIDKNGVIRAINGSPAATLNIITNFAHE